MAITLDYGYTAPTSTKNYAVYDVDYADWASTREKVDAKSVTVEAVNITSPLDRQAKMRTWRERVDNVYANGSVNAIYQSPIKEGVKIGHTVTTTISVTDSNDPTHPIYVPLSCTVSFMTGLNPNVTVAAIAEIAKETIGSMFPTDTVSTNQLAAWLAGSLTYLDETSGD